MKRTKRRRGLKVLGLILLTFVISYVSWTQLRSLPQPLPRTPASQIQKQTAPSTIVWPNVGQSAVGIVGSNILDTHGDQSPVPIASTAKIITALVVLRNKPLGPNQQGPLITLTASDAALYEAYDAQHGSVVPVQAGEQISEYQILQTILLPSANNMADSLAIWAYGSLGAYSEAANSYLKGLGLNSTHVGSDASGFSPTTTSTAHDLVRLGELTMQNPVLAQIVGQTTATGIPLAGTVNNVNFLLDSDNIIGVKTGNTDEAGGVFVSASRASVDGKPVTIVTALAGASSLFAALRFSEPLIQSAQTNFTPVTIIKAGTAVGSYSQPWGGTLPVIASQDLATTAWNGSIQSARVSLYHVAIATKQSQAIGTITTTETLYAPSKSIPLTLSRTPSSPTIWWRLTHPT